MPIPRKIAIAATIAAAFALTAARAARRPNDFAEAHWLLDYRFGFVRRGLAGALFRLARNVMDLRPTEQMIAVVAAVLFLVLCASLMAVAIRVLARNQWSVPAILVVLAFCSSPYVVMSAHLMGYYDHIFILLTIWTIALIFSGRVGPACALQVVAVLVHESAILVGFPLACFAWFHVNRRRVAAGEPGLSAAPLVLPVAAFAITTLAPLPPGFETHFAGRLAQFDFIDNNRDTLVPRWISTPFAESYSTTLLLDRALYTPGMHAVVLPSLLALLCFVVDGYRRSMRWIEWALLIVVCLAPQALHAVAWDTLRIGTYAIVCAFLTCWIYAEVRGPGRQVSAAATLVCGVAILLNVVTRTPLMDNERDGMPLSTRLALYAPFVGGAAALARRGRPDVVRVHETTMAS
jgi:hypothetical protein